MASVTIVYWRDIPAQVMVGKGRKAVKRALPDRFERTIGFAAKSGGAMATEVYLEQWRKAAPIEVPGEAEEAVEATVARLDAEYDVPRLKALIASGGYESEAGADATAAPDASSPAT